MSRAFDELKPYLDRAMALNTALVLFEWDNETLAPEQAGSLTGNVIGILSGEYFQAVNNDQVIRLAEACSRENDLTKAEAAQVRELLKEIEKLSHIPREEYQEYARLTAESARVWAAAKNADDFSRFAPVLKEIINWQKKFAGYRAKPGQKKYDVMLEDYEPGFSVERLDEFFDLIRKEIVPLFKSVMESGVVVWSSRDPPSSNSRKRTTYSAARRMPS